MGAARLQGGVVQLYITLHFRPELSPKLRFEKPRTVQRVEAVHAGLKQLRYYAGPRDLMSVP